jgi:dihydrofolate reductase
MIVALFAVDQAGGIGWKGTLPWPNNPDDMKWFKTTTQSQIVVMGRKTWDSPDMPSPLPGRINVLVTNSFIDREDIEQVTGDVCEALTTLQRFNKKKDIFVIGGASLLAQSKPVLDKLLITRIPGEYLSDVKLDVASMVEGKSLVNTINLGSCVVEEWQ